MLEYLQFNSLMLLRLAAAAILGGLIGIERGVRHDAGLRTHILVCLGAASVMVVSECLVIEYGISSEIMRMGAQVISGVGFLGAGSIIMDGNRVRGITTAAGLWSTACLGIVVGSGYYLIALFMALLMLFTMHWLRSLTRRIQEKSLLQSIRIKTENRDALQRMLNSLRKENYDVSAIRIRDMKPENIVSATLNIKLPTYDMGESLLLDLSEYDGVLELDRE